MKDSCAELPRQKKDALKTTATPALERRPNSDKSDRTRLLSPTLHKNRWPLKRHEKKSPQLDSASHQRGTRLCPHLHPTLDTVPTPPLIPEGGIPGQSSRPTFQRALAQGPTCEALQPPRLTPSQPQLPLCRTWAERN